MMKFVRWLGAFGSGSSLSEAAGWELSQIERQVAAEPLHRGRSLLSHAKIGLIIDHDISRFRAGWLTDAYTVRQDDGTLRPKSKPRLRQGRKFRDMDRFLAAWSAVKSPSYHAEAIFDAPHYCAVAVKSTATERGRRRAQRLADQLGMPLEVLAD